MKTHPVDVSAIAGYIAGGGLAGIFVFASTIWHGHEAQVNGAAIALVAAAGLVRVIFNRTPPAGTEPVLTTVPATPEKGS